MPVEVEVDLSPAALPKTMLVGLPEAAVKESTHRVERAIVNSGFIRPQDRVVINLAPGDLPKQAASFDLPIALGVLAGSGQFASDRLEHYAVVGELALEGHTRPVKGALSMAIAAAQHEVCEGWSCRRPKRRRRPWSKSLEVIPVGQLGPGGRLLLRRRWRSIQRPVGWKSCSPSSAPTSSTSATSAARRWPSGR